MPGDYAPFWLAGQGPQKALSPPPPVVSVLVVKAGSHRVLPLDVEEVRDEERQEKQDGEPNAAKRLVPRVRQEHPQLPLIVDEYKRVWGTCVE